MGDSQNVHFLIERHILEDRCKVQKQPKGKQTNKQKPKTSGFYIEKKIFKKLTCCFTSIL